MNPTEKRDVSPESQTENPNSIGEILSFGKDLPTRSDSVYQSVMGDLAIDDLMISGIVRNANAAGVKEQSRWGNRVFWSNGEEGKFHIVQKGGYVIEAPLAIAQKRIVRKEDVTAVYTKDAEGSVKDIFSEAQSNERLVREEDVARREAEDAVKIDVIRKQLGI